MPLDGAHLEEALDEAVVFLDVDGVLNLNWHGAERRHGSSSAPGSEDFLDEALLQNLAELLDRMRTDLGVAPRLVISSTWRLQPRLQATLYHALDGVGIGPGLFYGGGGGDVAQTPDLGNGTSPEGRKAEILSWLDHSQPERCCFVVLDDLNLLFDAAGNALSSSRVGEAHLVHTVSDEAEAAAASGGASKAAAAVAASTGGVGLTKARVAAALELLRQQQQQQQQQQIGAAGGSSGNIPSDFTPEEWWSLASSDIPLHLLRKERCPYWIKARARAYLDAEAKKTSQRMCPHCIVS